MDFSVMIGKAIISADKMYRYSLTRKFGDGPAMLFIMVNPSTADEVDNDPTIRKCMGFARRHDCGSIVVGNKFAYRSTEVSLLKQVADPVGPENDKHLMDMMRGAKYAVVGWGSLGKLPPRLRGRWMEIVDRARIAGVELKCFSTTADGHPRHPLMTGYDVPMEKWKEPKM